MSCLIAYYEPRTFIGHQYIKYHYNPESTNLHNTASHLKEVEGGYLTNRLDRFLINKLEELSPKDAEYQNILGFYAQQSLNSRSGAIIFEDGSRYIPDILKIGRSSNDPNVQEACLFLAYGIATKQQCYKPVFVSNYTIEKNYQFIENSELSRVGIIQP